MLQTLPANQHGSALRYCVFDLFLNCYKLFSANYRSEISCHTQSLGLLDNSLRKVLSDFLANENPISTYAYLTRITECSPYETVCRQFEIDVGLYNCWVVTT